MGDVTRVERFGEPFFLQWNLTDRCNLDCAHCYRESPVEDLDEAGLTSVVDAFAAFITESGRDGRVMLSGGEPLLSPHLFPLIERSRAHGLPVRVLSNGTLIDEVMARRLAAAGVQAVQVSVDGGRRTHDAVRGAGTFDRALAGMAALRAVGVDVTLAMTLSSANVRDLPAVLRIAENAASRFHIARHVPIGRGAALDARPLSPTELRRALVYLKRRRRRLARSGTDLTLRDPLWKALLLRGPGCEDCVSGCSVGYNGLCIDADGTAFPCRRLPVRLGNALTTPFPELWAHPALARMRDRDTLEGRCGRCEIRWSCGGCRAVAEALLGHPMAEDPQCFRRVPQP
ncbi:MAG: radical SAM protein [Coriobacteriia bacterium]|nr:radical SAM protein [Coriobacteriia bacterium]